MKFSKQAMQIAWPWREGSRPLQNATSNITRRAWIQTAVMLALAASMFFFFNKQILPLLILGLAMLNLGLALFMPDAFRAIELFWQRAARAAGIIMTWLLLVPFFYLCFLPARLILKISSRDPMRRKFPAPAPTCWTQRSGIAGVDRYNRQF